jgi:hypothetical protein
MKYSALSISISPHEMDFLRKVTADFKKLMVFMVPGKFGRMFTTKIFESKSSMTETVTLDATGTMMYLYIRFFGAPFPANPTAQQQENINKIWIAMNKPEKIVKIE